MANVITTEKVIDDNKRCLMKVVVIGDATNEANTVIVPAASLRFSLNVNSQVMSGLTDRKATYNVGIVRIFGHCRTANGYTKLQWRDTQNSAIVTIGNGNFDYNFGDVGRNAVLKANNLLGSNGDILLTSVSQQINDCLTLFLDLRKDGRDYDQGQTADPAAFNR